MNAEETDSSQRYTKLQKSFSLNLHGFTIGNMSFFEDMANVLCNIPFESVITSYNEYDESIDIKMSLSYNIKLSISRFVDINDDNVVFSIHRNKRLLISNEMRLIDLEQKIVELLEEFKKHL